MLHQRDYLWNCYEMCKNTDNAKVPTIGVARDMIETNIENGKAEFPGTYLPYHLLKQEWDAMTPEEKEQSRREWHMCSQFVGGREAFAAGDRAKFEELKEGKFQEELAKQEEAVG